MFKNLSLSLKKSSPAYGARSAKKSSSHRRGQGGEEGTTIDMFDEPVIRISPVKINYIETWPRDVRSYTIGDEVASWSDPKHPLCDNIYSGEDE